MAAELIDLTLRVLGCGFVGESMVAGLFMKGFDDLAPWVFEIPDTRLGDGHLSEHKERDPSQPEREKCSFSRSVPPC